MQVIEGKSVFKGVAIGPICLFQRQDIKVTDAEISDIETEKSRFESARLKAIEELKGLYEKTLKSVGEENAAIFEVHQMMLEDGDYQESILDMIGSEKRNAAYAVSQTGIRFAQMFSSMDDAYMKERAADVKDISERIVRILLGKTEGGIRDGAPVIVVADDLAPSETVSLDKSRILAFVTQKGSANSHTAILARMMNIPSIVNCGVELLSSYEGVEAVVDGFTGKLYIDPNADTLEEMKAKQKEAEEQRKILEELKGKENITRDGKKINLYANIGGDQDLDVALQNDAGGIGLFRSEFLYLGREDYPGEEEQFAVYKKVIEGMQGKKVIIRTLDIGADKQVDYFQMDAEENPAMGYRAIRICLDRQEMFKTQLRAIYRASAFGNTGIMFPMIISVEEIRAIKQMIAEIKAELDQEQIAYGEVELGIMIETPASVIISDLLAKEVSFFSIGTNDLTQYTLAIDRQNQKLEEIYDPHHPAVLRMIEMTVKNAHDAGIWVGICGELASDTELTETFLRMGIDELSVSPVFILLLRRKIRETIVGKK